MNTLQKVVTGAATVALLFAGAAKSAQASYKDFTVKSEIDHMTANADGSVSLFFKTTVQNNTDQVINGVAVRHKFKDEFSAKRSDVTKKDVSELVEFSNCTTENYKRESYGVKAVVSNCKSLFANAGTNTYYESYKFSADYVKRFSKGKETPVVTTRFFAEADQPHKALPKSAFQLDLKNLKWNQTEFRED